MTETSQRGLLDFSPTKKENKDKENEISVLSLIQFCRAPFVNFGTVKLGTSKCLYLRIENPTDDVSADVTIEKISSTKGFSANYNRFLIQPDSSFTLTISWTPAEEGGVRELIVFSANGVLKHQAVLLGRAEAPKKKKKSLWDSIKKKREANPTATPNCKNNESSLKITSNKTFQVPRKPQYKRVKPRSPLALFNQGVAIRDGSLSKPRSGEDCQQHRGPPTAAQRLKGLAGSDQAQFRHAQENTCVSLLSPATELAADLSNCSNVLLDLLGTPDHQGSTRVLNQTLSPVGTPEVFRRLMPRINSLDRQEQDTLAASKMARESPADPASQCFAPALTLSDALTLIDSDLHTGSGHHSLVILSDSLEPSCGNSCPGPLSQSHGVIPDSPDLSDCNGQRGTFFVSKIAIASGSVVGPEMVSVQTNQEVKKTSFTSATVTKSKAAAMVTAPNMCSPGGRRIRKSKRRLLEKTLELSESSGPGESSPGTAGLPVIHLSSGAKSWSLISQTTSSPHGPPTPIMFPISSLSGLSASSTPTRASFTATDLTSLPPSPHYFPTFSPSVSSPVSIPMKLKEICSPVGFALLPVGPRISEALPSSPAGLLPPPPAAASSSSSLSPEALMFTVHTKAQLELAKSKKRKSDEYLRSEERVVEVVRPDHVKRSRVVAATTRGSRRSAPEKKRAFEKPQRQQRPAGSVCSSSATSVKSARAAAPETSRPALRGALSLKAIRTGPVRTAKVVAVAQSKLTFIKPTQAAIARHPMPFAAKNMFYDERWIQKQESGFTCWINYILTPDDFKVNLEVTKVNALSIAMGGDSKYNVPKAPTKEELSFSTYNARRRLNRLRRSACQLFTSEVMVKAIQKLELEVEAKRLLVRKDRHLWKDIGERQKVLNWLLSYNPLWLRIGLETIYGELIPLESNSDVLGLAMFILTRLLWNPDIANEFRHAKVPNLYKDGHEEVLSRFSLKKLLLLVCFLDKAKESRLIEHDPCLFCIDAEFKTSKDLLLGFSRDFLSGEGILPRHLGYLGLPVSHVQKPLDEFNFAVKNLAVDLKCGIRLVRVMELFIQDWSLSRRLRLPAISRLQKVHNVEIAFHVLKANGVDLRDERGSVIESRDIVDGHREKTLSLLWKIIFAFQVEVILDETQLREEICFLKRTLRTKQTLASLRDDRGLQETTAGKEPAPVPFETSSTKIGLLMEWVNAVCAYYHLRVENFTVSFSDGRVLCYLIHHYHPGSLPEQAISRSTTQTVDCSPFGRVELDCSNSDSDSSFNFQPSAHKGLKSSSFEFKDLLENEKNNFRRVNSAVAFLGGVPAMINPSDMSNTIPNEKVVTSYLSFLCSRLLDLRNETRAARVIQEAWRNYRLVKDLDLYQQRNVAAAKIQRLVKSFLQRCRAERQMSAAILIQAMWRGNAARNALRLKREAHLWTLRHKAATIIQARWKMYSTKRSYQRLQYHVVIVQAQWRMRLAEIAYSKIHLATRVIQSYMRSYFVRKTNSKMQRAAIVIQANYRRYKQQSFFRRLRAATLVLQLRFRAQRLQRLQVQNYQRIIRSTITLQAAFRGMASRRKINRMHHAATAIQRAYRAHCVRQKYVALRSSALKLQQRFRANLVAKRQLQQYHRKRSAAILLQAAYRGQRARKAISHQHQAATVIQASFRRHKEHVKFQSMRLSTIVIQRYYRSCVVKRADRAQFLKVRWSAIVLQAALRGMASRRETNKMQQAANTIQLAYRAHRERQVYLALKSSALIIQQRFRANLVAKYQLRKYQHIRRAVILIQAAYRSHHVRKAISRQHQAATTIQAMYRKHREQFKFQSMRLSATIIQRFYKSCVLQRANREHFLKVKQSAIFLQAALRGYFVRMNISKMQRAATVIQANYKRYKQQSSLRRLRFATLVLQQRFRAQRLKSLQVKNYQRIRRSTITLQAAFRGMASRRKINRMHHASTAIQRAYRAHCVRQKYVALRSSALKLQQHFRANLVAKRQLKQYHKKRSAAIMLQAAYRGQRARKAISLQHQAATVIQASFRRHKEHVKFQSMRLSTIVIQRYYRSCVVQRADRAQFLKVRRSAIVLQAAVRGMASRREANKMQQAANTIQLAYRAHRERQVYLALKSSALIIQQCFRANLVAKYQLRKYQHIRRAVILIQAAYRGHHVRKAISRQHQAATTIQAMYKKHREQVKFQSMRLSATILQRYYKSCVLQRANREHFLKVKQSAVFLQAALRGYFVRMNISKMQRAATVIQANYKRYKQQSSLRRLRFATLVLQQRFRAQRLKSLQVKNYQRIRRSTITLQAAFRGMASRRKINRMHHASTAIQRAYRAHCVRQKYVALRSSALKLQQHFRANLVAKRQLKQYHKKRSAAIMLQAAYRGQRARKAISLQHQAATVIQASFRRHKEHVKFQSMRLSTIVIQRYYRSCVVQRADRAQFLKVRRSAIVLQAAVRGMASRREANKMQQAANTIQLAYRAHCERQVYLALKSSALIIQQRFRANFVAKYQLRKYQHIRRAVILIQAAYRGHHVRKAISRQHQAATTIQAMYRKHREQVKFQSMRLSATIIQRYYKSCVLQRANREHFLKVKQSAVFLQAALRGYFVRMNISKMQRAATVIQANYKRYKQQSSLRRLRFATLVLQQRFRAQRLKSLQVKNYQRIRRSTITLQAAFRGMASRRKINRMHHASTAIQRAYRAHCVRQKYVALRSSALKLQQHFRANLFAKRQSQQYHKKRSAAILLQAAYRGQRARKAISLQHQAATVIQASFRRHKDHVKFQSMRLSTIVIQRYYRSCVVQRADRAQFLEVRRSAIVLQAAVRGMASRRKANKMQQAANTIQLAYRAHTERQVYLALKSSALIIQQRFRANLVAKYQSQKYQQIRRAVILIQAAYRGRQVRKAISRQHQAATTIQAMYRKHREQVNFQAMRLSTITIQRYYRSCVLQKADRGHFLSVKQSAIVLQAAFRGCFIRRAINDQHCAATLIQSRWRGLVKRRSYHRVKVAAISLQRILRTVWLARSMKQHDMRERRAAITIQAHFRGWIERRQMVEKKNAEKRLRFSAAAFQHVCAMKIQRALRAHWTLQSAKKQINSVIAIQRWVRAWQQRRRYLEEKKNVIIVQRKARQWLAHRHQAASIIQHRARRLLLQRRQQRVLRGVIKAQALWRGHRSRKLSDNPVVLAARQRLSKVSSNVREEDTLGNKTASALEYLLRYKHFSCILEALKNLETATRLSPECCERLVETGATLVIFTLIRSCNRSVPCMDVITFSIQILLNLSKYHKTVAAVYAVENSVETLLDLLQRYRDKAGDKVADKGGSIFTKACFLLALLLQDRCRALEVSRLPKALDRIRSVYRLTARKYHMDTERTIAKQRMNASSSSSSFLVPATPRKSRPVRRFAPDWVLQKDKLRDIVEPLSAIKMVADTFSIVI